VLNAIYLDIVIYGIFVVLTTNALHETSTLSKNLNICGQFYRSNTEMFMDKIGQHCFDVDCKMNECLYMNEYVFGLFVIV